MTKEVKHKLNKEDLIGKMIETIDINGYGIEIHFTDGTEFVYYASDAGYSSWNILKGDEEECVN